jgi:hypothetical protein
MKKAYVAWRHPETTSWHPIGLLSEEVGQFHFEYLLGARLADGFVPLSGFPDLDVRYESESLFPIFSNRLMVSGRKDYLAYLNWLGLEKSAGGSLLELVTSGGRRVGDQLEIFSVPESPVDGRYQSVFFLHGLRFQAPDVLERVASLRSGDRLDLAAEPGNPHDPCAHQIMVSGLKIGYVPRYLSCDIASLQQGHSVGSRLGDEYRARLSVENVNPDAPLSHRISCRFSAPWPDGFTALSGEEFKMLAPQAV